MMSLTEHPRLLARVAGALYVSITALALFAYMYVRGQLIVPGDMAQTASNIVAHEQLYRSSLAAGVVVVMCNLAMGLIFYELFKVVNRFLASLALVFIIVSATLEAANLLNHFQTLLPLTSPDHLRAFDLNQRLALARTSMRLFPVAFGLSLSFFGVFCFLIGYLILRSRFLPPIFGVLMVMAGVRWLVDSFTGFLALPSIPYIHWVTLIAEPSLALWLVIVGVNEEKWRAQARASAGAQ
jgi:hypothetical protein